MSELLRLLAFQRGGLGVLGRTGLWPGQASLFLPSAPSGWGPHSLPKATRSLLLWDLL